jgi:hypothetical protein
LIELIYSVFTGFQKFTGAKLGIAAEKYKRKFDFFLLNWQSRIFRKNRKKERK